MKIKLSTLLSMLNPFKNDTLITIGSGYINNTWYWVVKTKDEYGYEREIYCPMYEEN